MMQPQKLTGGQQQDLARQLLASYGIDMSLPELVDTPERLVLSLKFLLHGYEMNPKDILGRASFPDGHRNMVIVRDIEFYSLCEHHILPFYGRAHVAYIPNGNIVGLSKIARMVDAFARRLQVQERLTDQVADALMEVVQARGVGVVLTAFHMCMSMRGVQKHNAQTITSAMRGSLLEDPRARDEFLHLIDMGKTA